MDVSWKSDSREAGFSIIPHLLGIIEGNKAVHAGGSASLSQQLLKYTKENLFAASCPWTRMVPTDESQGTCGSP